MVTVATCGAGNGVPSIAAPTALCAAGTPTTVTTGTTAFTWTCAGAGGGANASCSAPKIGLGNASFGAAAIVGTTVPAAGVPAGPGSASFTTANGGATCGFDMTATGFIASSAPYPATGATQPQGMFRFKLINCASGVTARVSVTWPSLAGMTVYKYGKATLTATTSSFFGLSNASVSGNTVSFDVTDGQVGDDDGVLNGEIIDPVVPVAVPELPVPTLGGWWLFVLALMAASGAAVALRRRV